MSSIKPKEKVTETKKMNSGWMGIWWVLFPPYAIYRFIRYSPKKWYIKIPVTFIIVFVMIISLDLAISPHRVEQAEAKQAITFFTSERGAMGETRKVERIGEGVSIKGKKLETVVYYRALTENGLYNFGLFSKNGKELNVKYVEQLYPIRIDVKDSEERAKAEVAIWLKENQEKIGKATELLETSEDGLAQTVKTNKGVYEFKIGGQSVYEVNRIDKKENLLKQKNEPTLPAVMQKYLKKDEEKIGKLTKTLGYEMNSLKETYYFRTTKGDFRAEIYHDGSVEIGKKRE